MAQLQLKKSIYSFHRIAARDALALKVRPPAPYTHRPYALGAPADISNMDFIG